MHRRYEKHIKIRFVDLEGEPSIKGPLFQVRLFLAGELGRGGGRGRRNWGGHFCRGQGSCYKIEEERLKKTGGSKQESPFRGSELQ